MEPENGGTLEPTLSPWQSHNCFRKIFRVLILWQLWVIFASPKFLGVKNKGTILYRPCFRLLDFDGGVSLHCLLWTYSCCSGANLVWSPTWEKSNNTQRTEVKVLKTPYSLTWNPKMGGWQWISCWISGSWIFRKPGREFSRENSPVQSDHRSDHGGFPASSFLHRYQPPGGVFCFLRGF